MEDLPKLSIFDEVISYANGNVFYRLEGRLPKNSRIFYYRFVKQLGFEIPYDPVSDYSVLKIDYDILSRDYGKANIIIAQRLWSNFDHWGSRTEYIGGWPNLRNAKGYYFQNIAESRDPDVISWILGQIDDFDAVFESGAMGAKSPLFLREFLKKAARSRVIIEDREWLYLVLKRIDNDDAKTLRLLKDFFEFERYHLDIESFVPYIQSLEVLEALRGLADGDSDEGIRAGLEDMTSEHYYQHKIFGGRESNLPLIKFYVDSYRIPKADFAGLVSGDTRPEILAYLVTPPPKDSKILERLFYRLLTTGGDYVDENLRLLLDLDPQLRYPTIRRLPGELSVVDVKNEFVANLAIDYYLSKEKITPGLLERVISGGITHKWDLFRSPTLTRVFFERYRKHFVEDSELMGFVWEALNKAFKDPRVAYYGPEPDYGEIEDLIDAQTEILESLEVLGDIFEPTTEVIGKLMESAKEGGIFDPYSLFRSKVTKSYFESPEGVKWIEQVLRVFFKDAKSDKLQDRHFTRDTIRELSEIDVIVNNKALLRRLKASFPKNWALQELLKIIS